MIKMKNKIILVFGILLVLNLLVGVSAFGYSEDDEGNSFLETEDEVRAPSITLRDLITLQPSSEPSNPELGMIYFDANSKRLKLYDGTGWFSIALEKVSSVSKEQAEKTIEREREVQTCSESIECGDWGDCINNYQSVTCITISESCNKYEDVETKDCIIENLFEEEIQEEIEISEDEIVGEEQVEKTTPEETLTEESTEEVASEEAIPEELFDITFDLEQTTITSAEDLLVWITLQNFGKRYIPTRLIYIISDESGNEMHREFEEARVYTDKVIIKEFGDLELENGKYNVKLKVEYGGIVEEFDADFEIDDGLLTRIKTWLRDIFR